MLTKDAALAVLVLGVGGEALQDAPSLRCPVAFPPLPHPWLSDGLTSQGWFKQALN